MKRAPLPIPRRRKVHKGDEKKITGRSGGVEQQLVVGLLLVALLGTDAAAAKWQTVRDGELMREKARRTRIRNGFCV